MTARNAVISAVKEVLRVSDVSDTDNFFRLGGDSLSAIELMEAVETALSIEFPLDVLFTSGQIGELVDECQSRVAAAS